MKKQICNVLLNRWGLFVSSLAYGAIVSYVYIGIMMIIIDHIGTIN